jgi:hypothetical protein
MIIFLNSINSMLSVMEMHRAFCEVKTELLNMNSMNIKAQNKDGNLAAFARIPSFMTAITKARQPIRKQVR